MFITLQLSFVDLRYFLKYPLKIVPVREEKLTEMKITDLEAIAKKEYVRCFGHYQLRSYVPDFRKKRKKYKYAKNDKWDKLESLWKEEYLYASARRGLRFEFLEKQKLLNGKLVNPRAKIRALRYFPFDLGDGLWTPCMRIETGILFDVTAPLDERELVQALNEFTKLKVNVPLYTREGSQKDASQKTKLHSNTLIGQQKMLAQLIVNGTTAHQELRVSKDMIFTGDPLLNVHYTKNEISKLPENVIALPKAAAQKANISFLPIRNPHIGAWLFELPNHRKKAAVKTKEYEVIRNTTIAIMRYWSEFQAVISLRNAVITDAFDFNLGEEDRMMKYLDGSTDFLLSGKWRGVSLQIIRDVLNTYEEAEPVSQEQVNKVIEKFPLELREKLLAVGKPRQQVFVSYSHKDAAHLPSIQNALSNLNRSHKIEYFDDTDIKGGEEWAKKINSNLENASVAILLISPGFLASEFINTKELPVIKDRFEHGKLNIIPVLINGAIPKDELLGGLQFINGNDPLLACTEEKKKEIMRSLANQVRSFI